MKTLFALALCFTAAASAIAQEKDGNLAPTPEPEVSSALSSASSCYEIRTYCYNMWIIRRRNYPQYVGCVYSNAENNGLQCNP